MFDLQSYLSLKRKQVDYALVKQMENSPFADHRITLAMTYSLMAGGKRLRPILCLAASEAVNGKLELKDKNSKIKTQNIKSFTSGTSTFYLKLMQVACALEIIHTY